MSLGAAALLVWLGAGEARAQFNPSGWIQTDGWNFLMPLTTNDSCGGGGAGKMSDGNWIAPHDIATTDPKFGESYVATKGGNLPIDFGGTAHSTGWGGAGVTPNPTWFTTAFLEGVFAGTSLPNGDLVNYDDDDDPDAGLDLVDYINVNIVPFVNTPPGPNLPGDNALAIATTYVENTSGGVLDVEICTASDDSILVYVNNLVITNVSLCRGSAGNCQEVRRALLPPGVSKIATLVWEGGGGWNFRLGLRIGGVLITDATAEAAGLVFLGPGDTGDNNYMGQLQYPFVRSLAGIDPAGCLDTNQVGVHLQGTGGNEADVIDIVERITASDLGLGPLDADFVSGVTGGGVISDITTADRAEPNVTTLPLNTLILRTGRTACDGTSATTDNGGGSYTSRSTTGQDLWDGGDSFEFQYAEVTGDFDFSVEVLNYNHSTGAGRWGKIGPMARQELTDNSRHIMAQFHGPNITEDVARQAGRTVHNVSAGNVYEQGYTGDFGAIPRFLRVVRRGNLFTTYVSDRPGLADGTLNPCNDGNWSWSGRTDDWGAGAPATIFVGFANSEHESDRGDTANPCPAQTVDFQVLACAPGAPTVTGKQIAWAGITRGTANAGFDYAVQNTARVAPQFSGEVVDEASTSGAAAMTLIPNNPVGVFEGSRNIGYTPTPGVISEAGGVYTMSGSGIDIWDGGDNFHFAYQVVTGDFDARVRFLTRTTNPAGFQWGRHGLMARYTCATNAKFSMGETLFPTTNAQDIPRHHFRVNNNQNDLNREYYQVDDGTFPTEGRLPTWHRLVRQGRVISSYMAEDADMNGEPDNWCLVGSDTAARPNDLFVGVAVQGRHGDGAEVTFDNLSIEPLDPGADLSCTADGEILSYDYELADGSAPPDARTAVRGGTFIPETAGGRLRLTQEGITGSANAVWYLPGADAENGFTASFDAFMSHSVLPGDANPADGMTFAVVQGSTDLIPTCPPSLEDPTVSAFPDTAFVGTDCGGGSSTTDLGGGSYTLVSTSGNDIWAGGDDFIYQYTTVSGDFDIAVEMSGYMHSTNAGQWGKFGIMARQDLDRASLFTMAQAHGPATGDGARQAGRRVHLDTGNVYDDVNFGLGHQPRFLRLTRRGNVFQAWASNNPGLADGSADPCRDCNWTAGAPQDWGETAPADVLVGLANSEHNSNDDAGCTAGMVPSQTISFRLLSGCSGGAAFTGLGGDGGGALGFEGGTLRGVTECHPSFSVELDNWVGGGEPANETADGGSTGNDGAYHFGLNVNAAVSSLQTNVDFGVPTASLPALFAQMGGEMGVHVEVIYAPSGQINVFATGNDGVVGRTHVLSGRIQPLTGPFIAGFTAGTGGAHVTSEVDNFSLTAACCEDTDTISIAGPTDPVATGSTVELNTTAGGTNTGGTESYAWEIIAGTGTLVGATDGPSVMLMSDVDGDVTVQVTYDDGVCTGSHALHLSATATFTVTFATLGGLQQPGDINQDGLFNLSDPIGTLQYLFVGGDALPPPCGDNTILHESNKILLDSNDDDNIDLADPIYDLNYLFVGGPPPVSCVDMSCVGCILIPECPSVTLGNCAP